MSVRFSTSDAIAIAWERYKEHSGPLLGTFILVGVACAVPFVAYVMFMFIEDYQWVGVILYCIGLLVVLYAGMGFTKIGVMIADKKPWSMGDLLPAGNRMLPYLGAAALYMLITTAGMFMLLVPGMYWSVRFGAWRYFVIEKGEGAVQSLKSSWALTDGSFWDIFSYRLAYGMLMYLSVFTLGLALIIFIPMLFIADGYVFRQLERHPFTPAA